MREEIKSKFVISPNYKSFLYLYSIVDKIWVKKKFGINATKI